MRGTVWKAAENLVPKLPVTVRVCLAEQTDPRGRSRRAAQRNSTRPVTLDRRNSAPMGWLTCTSVEVKRAISERDGEDISEDDIRS